MVGFSRKVESSPWCWDASFLQKGLVELRHLSAARISALSGELIRRQDETEALLSTAVFTAVRSPTSPF